MVPHSASAECRDAQRDHLGSFGDYHMSKSKKGSGFVAAILAAPMVEAAEAVEAAASDNVSESTGPLSADTVSGFKALADKVGQSEAGVRRSWSGFRADFAKLTADFPRLENGALDRDSAQCVAARELFVPAMAAALVVGGSYDRALVKSGDNDYRVVGADQESNYLLTGANAISMDRKTLAALPSLTDHPYGLRRFVESIRKTVDNTATKAWGRFFEADFVEKSNNGRGPAQPLAGWLADLSKPLVAKANAARRENLITTSDVEVRAAHALFV
jgi:hypothetical protein